MAGRLGRAVAPRAAAGVLWATALLAGSETALALPGPPIAAPASSQATGAHVMAAWSDARSPWPSSPDPDAAGDTRAQAPTPSARHEPAWLRWGWRLAALGVGAGLGWLLLRLGRSEAGRGP